MAEHKIDGNDGAGNAIAMARDNARDAALVEAAAVAIARKGNGEATLDHPYDKGYLAACDSCAAAIIALRDKPAPAFWHHLPDMVDAATAAGVAVWWDSEAQEIKMTVTVQEAARVLLDLLKTPSEKAPIEASHIEDVWTATFRKSGFAAVRGFLRAIAGGEA